jgi:hypothetical protein
MYLHIPHDFVVLTSLTHPRKILLVVLQIGKAKDLSAPLRRGNKLVWVGFDILQTGRSLLNAAPYFISTVSCYSRQ